MTARAVAERAVERLAEDYRRRGYDVVVKPHEDDLPNFLAGYRPDIIARGANESVVVEVKVGTQTSAAERFRETAERVSREPGWRFALVYVNPSTPDDVTEAEPAPLPELQERAENADSLLRAGQPEAAFLLFWSVLEGTLRLLGRRAQLPLESLPSSTLIRELYSAGEMSRGNFETLMNLLPVRNRLAHGLRRRGGETEVEPLRELVRSLLQEARNA